MNHAGCNLPRLLIRNHIQAVGCISGSPRGVTVVRYCLLALLFITSPSFAQDPAERVRYLEQEIKDFSFFPGGKIGIDAGAPGTLTIIGWRKGSVHIEAEKIAYDLEPEKAKTLLQKSLRVRWNQTAATIKTAPFPEAEVEINLTVYVPEEKTDIKARIAKGNFLIDSVNGWVETTTVGEGGLEAEGLSGYFSFNTPKGDLKVYMSGKRWRGLEFAAATQDGSAQLILPVDYSSALQLETRNGKLTVDYPQQIVEGEPEPPDIVINKTGQSLKATVGDGGAPVRLFTFSGDVALSKKTD